jgi:hypothetical protein
MEWTEMFSRLLFGKPEGKRHLQDSGVDKRMILKCPWKEYGDRSLTGLKWFRTGQVVCSKNVKNFLPRCGIDGFQD